MTYIYTTPLTSERYISHHGILGQKWGVRRFQNKDGSLTAAGRKRYSDSDSDSRASSESKVTYNGERVPKNSSEIVSRLKPRSPYSDLSDQELQDAINRIQKEKQLRDLTQAQQTTFQKAFARAKDTVVESLVVGSGLLITRTILNKVSDSNLGNVIMSAANHNFGDVVKNSNNDNSNSKSSSNNSNASSKTDTKRTQREEERTRIEQEQTKQAKEKASQQQARTDQLKARYAANEAKRKEQEAKRKYKAQG